MLEEAKINLKNEIEPRIKKFESGRLHHLDWREKWKWKIVNVLDTIDEAIKAHEAKKSWWERWGKRILKIAEALLIVASKVL